MTAIRTKTEVQAVATACTAACLWPLAASAQQPAQQPAQQQQQQQNNQWDRLPRMQLERQFAGPLRDTVIQRWRDPNDGTVCYLYLPISAPHTPPAPGGFVQYGATTIGSISCAPESGAARAAAPRPAPRTVAPAPPLPPAPAR